MIGVAVAVHAGSRSSHPMLHKGKMVIKGTRPFHSGYIDVDDAELKFSDPKLRNMLILGHTWRDDDWSR